MLVLLCSASVVPLVRVWFVRTHEKAEGSRCGWLSEVACASAAVSDDGLDGTAATPITAAVDVVAGEGDAWPETSGTHSGVEAALRFRLTRGTPPATAAAAAAKGLPGLVLEVGALGGVADGIIFL